MKVTLCQRDCLEVMRGLADGSVVTIADPPYGIGRDWEKRSWRTRALYRKCAYMNARPSPEYFREMQRVSSDWIIWGWNYFTDILPPTNYLVVWDKMSQNNPVFKYSKCEIAGTTYRIPCNLVALGWTATAWARRRAPRRSTRTRSRSPCTAGSWRPTSARTSGT